MTPSSRRMLASMLLGNARQPVQHPLQAISNLANTYFGYKSLGQADEAEKVKKAKKAKIMGRALSQLQPTKVMVGSDAPLINAVPKYETKEGNMSGAIQTLASLPETADLAFQLQMKDIANKNALAQAREMRKITLRDKLDELNVKNTFGQNRDINKELIKLNIQRNAAGLNSLTLSDFRAMTTASPNVSSNVSSNIPITSGSTKPPTSGSPKPPTLAEVQSKLKVKTLGEAEEAKEEAKLKIKRKEEKPGKLRFIQSKIDAIPALEKNMEKLINLTKSDFVGGRTGVVGRRVSPGGDQAKLDQTVLQFQGLVGLDKLLAIKAQGGTLGALSKSEMDLLTSTIGSLDTITDMETLRENVKEAVRLYKKGIRGEIESFNDIYKEAPFKNTGLLTIKKASQEIQNKTVSNNKTDNDAAREWLKNNPNHPDAEAIRKKLGL
jgi:hypothetical protein